MVENELKRIIADYKAELAAAGSEYKRQCAMEYAFNRILELVDDVDGGEK